MSEIGKGNVFKIYVALITGVVGPLVLLIAAHCLDKADAGSAEPDSIENVEVSGETQENSLIDSNQGSNDLGSKEGQTTQVSKETSPSPPPKNYCPPVESWSGRWTANYYWNNTLNHSVLTLNHNSKSVKTTAIISYSRKQGRHRYKVKENFAGTINGSSVVLNGINYHFIEKAKRNQGYLLDEIIC